MIDTAVCISAKADFLRGIHQPGDTYKIALYTEDADLGASTTAYDPANEVSSTRQSGSNPARTGYVAGGKNLSGFAVSSDGGSAIMTFDTPVWNASTITARGAMIYNASRSNRSLATFDFGGNITSTNGPFRANIPAATEDAGLIVIG